MDKKLKPLMQFILDEELKTHPEKEKSQEEKNAILAQELLEKLWAPEEKQTTFWAKVKSVLSDDSGLPQKLFNRISDFRTHHELKQQKEKMQHILFYATSAFRRATDMLARACYLFDHNPRAFEKYATSSVDFAEDVRQSTYDDENVFMPALAIPGAGVAIVTGQSECEEKRTDDRRLPLLSFAPIRYGQNPVLMASQQEFEKHKGLYSEISLRGFSVDPYRYAPLKKLFYIDQPESNYPAMQHQSIVVAMNAFSRVLENEPVKICSHHSNSISSDKQRVR